MAALETQIKDNTIPIKNTKLDASSNNELKGEYDHNYPEEEVVELVTTTRDNPRAIELVGEDPIITKTRKRKLEAQNEYYWDQKR